MGNTRIRTTLRQLLSVFAFGMILTACGLGGEEDTQLEAPDFSLNPNINITPTSSPSLSDSPRETPTQNIETISIPPTSITVTSPEVTVVALNPTDTPSQDNSVNFNLIPNVQSGNFVLPAIEGLEGTLVVMRGFNLFALRFDGQPPVNLTEALDEVNLNSITISPDGRYLTFFGRRGIRSQVFLTDLTSPTLETKPLTRVNGVFGTVSWSPNMQWLIINNFEIGLGINVILVDGSTLADETPRVATISEGLGFGSLWLADNRIASYQPEGNVTQTDFAPPQFTSLRIDAFDPLTQETTVIGSFPSEDGFNFNWQSAFDQSIVLDYAIYNPFTPVNNAINVPNTLIGYDVIALNSEENTTAVPTCFDVRIRRIIQGASPSLETVYQNNQTLLISDLQIHSDGQTLLFLRWYLTACDAALNTDNIKIDLMQLLPSGEVSVLQADLFSGNDLNLQFIRGQNGLKYTLSPDGNYLLWLGGSTNGRTSTLNLMKLSTGENITVLLEQGGAGFVENRQLQSVYWGIE